MTIRIVPAITMILVVALGSFMPTAVVASTFSNLKGDPHVRSASALVIDIDGNVIYGKDIDTVRPIASITKLMTAMVIIDSGVDLQEKISGSAHGFPPRVWRHADPQADDPAGHHVL